MSTRVEIVQDDGFQNEVAPVGVRVHAGEDFGEFLVVVRDGLCAVLAPFGQECFHAVETGFVERFKDVERGKDERARAAGGVEDGDGGDGLPEGHEQVRAFAILDDILRELAEIEIEGDEVVDLADFAGGEFLPDFLVTLPAGDDFAPDFGWQRIFAGRGFVPRLAAFDQVGLGSVQAGRDFRPEAFLSVPCRTAE